MGDEYEEFLVDSGVLAPLLDDLHIQQSRPKSEEQRTFARTEDPREDVYVDDGSI